MTTPAKNSCAFCPTPAHHTSVLHFLVHKMQLEALCGNRAFLLKCNYSGNRGRPWENSEELRRSVGICGELWRACSALWELLASRRLRMKSKEMFGHVMYQRPILRDCMFFWPVCSYAFSLESIINFNEISRYLI